MGSYEADAYDAGDAAWLDDAPSPDDAANIFSDVAHAVGHAVSSAVHAVENVVEKIPGVNVVLLPIHLAEALAKGDLKRFGEDALHAGIGAIDLAKQGMTFVPGIGTVGAAALGAAQALASGQSIGDIGLAALRSGMPGGALGQMAFDAGLNLAKGGNVADTALNAIRSQVPGGTAGQSAFDAALSIARGGNVGTAALDAARKNLPNDAARIAFDAGLAMAHGHNAAPESAPQRAAATAAAKAQASMHAFGAAGSALAARKKQAALIAKVATASHALGSAAAVLRARKAAAAASANAPPTQTPTTVVTPMPLVPMVSVRPLAAPDVLGVRQLGQAAPSLTTTLPGGSGLVAQTLLRAPALRSMPADAVGRELQVPIIDVRRAFAAIAGTARRIGKVHPTMLPSLRAYPELESQIGGESSLDETLAQFASNARPPTASTAPYARRGGRGQLRARCMTRPMVAKLLQTAPVLRNLSAQQLSAIARPVGAAQASGLDNSGTHYIVEKGDSLSKIAGKLGTSLNALEAANRQIKNYDLIYPGQVLNLPPGVGGAPAPTSLPTGVPTTTVTPSGARVYVVRSGDTPGKIANALTGNADRWPELDNANSDHIPRVAQSIWVGESLRIPASWPEAGPVVTPPAPPPMPTAPPVLPPFPTLPPIPTPTGQGIPGSQVLQVQALLAAWAKVTPGASPSDFGTQAGDLYGAINPRTTQALGSFQTYSNTQRGTSLRTDGELDDATYQALVAWAQSHLTTAFPPVVPGTTTTTPPVLPPLPGIPPTTITPSTPVASGKKSSDDGILGALLAAGTYLFMS